MALSFPFLSVNILSKIAVFVNRKAVIAIGLTHEKLLFIIICPGIPFSLNFFFGQGNSIYFL